MVTVADGEIAKYYEAEYNALLEVLVLGSVTTTKRINTVFELLSDLDYVRAREQYSFGWSDPLDIYSGPNTVSKWIWQITDKGRAYLERYATD